MRHGCDRDATRTLQLLRSAGCARTQNSKRRETRCRRSPVFLHSRTEIETCCSLSHGLAQTSLPPWTQRARNSPLEQSRSHLRRHNRPSRLSDNPPRGDVFLRGDCARLRSHDDPLALRRCAARVAAGSQPGRSQVAARSQPGRSQVADGSQTAATRVRPSHRSRGRAPSSSARACGDSGTAFPAS